MVSAAASFLGSTMFGDKKTKTKKKKKKKKKKKNYGWNEYRKAKSL